MTIDVIIDERYNEMREQRDKIDKIKSRNRGAILEL